MTPYPAEGQAREKDKSMKAKRKSEANAPAETSATVPRLWRYCHGIGKPMPDGHVVGGIDAGGEGLLLLTNDAEVARLMGLASSGWVSHFLVQVSGKLAREQLSGLAATPVVAGVQYGPVAVRLARCEAKSSWLDVALREGRGRDVNRLLQSLGLLPIRIARVSFGPYKLGELQAGCHELVAAREWQRQLGGKYASSDEDRGRKV